jgi:hypothetical protein
MRIKCRGQRKPWTRYVGIVVSTVRNGYIGSLNLKAEIWGNRGVCRIYKVADVGSIAGKSGEDGKVAWALYIA